MTARPCARRHTRAPVWCLGGVISICLILSVGLGAVGCGGSTATQETSSTTTDGGTTPGGTVAAAHMSPTALGEAIGATWAEAMQKLDTLLAGSPAPEAVQSQVEELKETYVQELVVYGRQKEELDEAGKAQVDAAVTSALGAAAGTEWYSAYMAAYEEYVYSSGNVDFCNLLASFHILTQYADFELLKSQEPEEAARLGIQ